MSQIAANNPTAALGIDDLPVAPSRFKAVVVSLATVMFGLLGVASFWIGPRFWSLLFSSEENIPALIHLEDVWVSLPLSYLFHVYAILGMLCFAAGLLSLIPIWITRRILQGVLGIVFFTAMAAIVLVWLAIDSLADAAVPVNGLEMDNAQAFVNWFTMSFHAMLIALYVFWLHVMLRSRPVYAVFTGKQGGPMPGDKTIENWRTHGRDPRARKSSYGGVLTHIIVLILIPLLLGLDGCVTAYRVPKGSGEPAVIQVQVVKQKKKKKQTLTLRPNSAILFDIPDLDDTEVDKIMEQMTQATYEASVNAKAGNIGKGGGKEGGWPEGMENYKIRFIRLDHGGAGWDDGMNQTDADINFLRAFAAATPFKKIANKGESHSVALLDKYPDDGFPPFVYLTGESNIGRLSTRDIKILREYCLKGGMLIGDAGSKNFDRSFRDLMRRVFPDKPLLDIADDDMLYQLPYGFPNGAPAFWHHGGRRALGIKHEGRWCVFYHPGDMNDAWKSPGYSDVTPEMKQAAEQLGVNLIYYAFNQWNDAVAKERK